MPVQPPNIMGGGLSMDFPIPTPTSNVNQPNPSHTGMVRDPLDPNGMWMTPAQAQARVDRVNSTLPPGFPQLHVGGQPFTSQTTFVTPEGQSSYSSNTPGQLGQLTSGNPGINWASVAPPGGWNRPQMNTPSNQSSGSSSGSAPSGSNWFRNYMNNINYGFNFNYPNFSNQSQDMGF